MHSVQDLRNLRDLHRDEHFMATLVFRDTGKQVKTGSGSSSHLRYRWWPTEVHNSSDTDRSYWEKPAQQRPGKRGWKNWCDACEREEGIDSASDKPRRAVHSMLTYDKVRLAIRASCHFASMRADTCIPWVREVRPLTGVTPSPFYLIITGQVC